MCVYTASGNPKAAGSHAIGLDDEATSEMRDAVDEAHRRGIKARWWGLPEYPSFLRYDISRSLGNLSTQVPMNLQDAILEHRPVVGRRHLECGLSARGRSSSGKLRTVFEGRRSGAGEEGRRGRPIFSVVASRPPAYLIGLALDSVHRCKPVLALSIYQLLVCRGCRRR